MNISRRWDSEEELVSSCIILRVPGRTENAAISAPFSVRFEPVTSPVCLDQTSTEICKNSNTYSIILGTPVSALPNASVVPECVMGVVLACIKARFITFCRINNGNLFWVVFEVGRGQLFLHCYTTLYSYIYQHWRIAPPSLSIIELDAMQKTVVRVRDIIWPPPCIVSFE